MQQYLLQYVQVALGRELPGFFFFIGGTKFTHVQYINIMYVLDSIRQKFVCVAFLSDNETRPVNVRQKCGGRFRRRISIEFISFN